MCIRKGIYGSECASFICPLSDSFRVISGQNRGTSRHASRFWITLMDFFQCHQLHLYNHYQMVNHMWSWKELCLLICGKPIGDQGPISQAIFFALMETLPCCNYVVGHQIVTNFCPCHDSTTVVPCTKFCSDHCIRMEVRVKRNFHRVWIAMENVSEMGPRLAWYPYSKG